MVSRSAYQKVVEENKRMRKDLKIIVTSPKENEVHYVLLKWKDIFLKETQQKFLIETFLKQLLSKHPEYSIRNRKSKKPNDV